MTHSSTHSRRFQRSESRCASDGSVTHLVPDGALTLYWVSTYLDKSASLHRLQNKVWALRHQYSALIAAIRPQWPMVSGRMRINHGIYSIHNLIFHLPGLRHAMYPRMDSKQYVRCIPLLTLVNYRDLSETMNRPCDGWRCYVKREVGEFKEGRIQTHPQALQLN